MRYWRSRNQSSQDFEQHSDDFSKVVIKSRSRKYPKGYFLKTIISCYLQHLKFQKARHACMRILFLSIGISCTFASDRSPKWIDRDGQKNAVHTGSRQWQLHFSTPYEFLIRQNLSFLFFHWFSSLIMLIFLA